MRVIIDRFEGDWAVLEYSGGRTVNFPAAFLPGEAREGDVLEITITLGKEKTASRKKAAEELVNSLFED